MDQQKAWQIFQYQSGKILQENSQTVYRQLLIKIKIKISISHFYFFIFLYLINSFIF